MSLVSNAIYEIMLTTLERTFLPLVTIILWYVCLLFINQTIVTDTTINYVKLEAITPYQPLLV